MSKAILYYLAAGATGVGGPAAAGLLLRRGHQEAAADTQARKAKSIDRLLQIEIDRAPLREQALAVGVDPDLVEQRYRNMRDGPVTIDQLLANLRRLGHG